MASLSSLTFRALPYASKAVAAGLGAYGAYKGAQSLFNTFKRDDDEDERNSSPSHTPFYSASPNTNLFDTVYNQVKPQLEQELTRKASLGSSSQGTGGSTAGNPQQKVNTPSFDFEKEANKLGQDAATTRDQFSEEQKKLISESYQPIFSELDRQLGDLPNVRTALESRAEELAGQQRTAVEGSRTASQASLDQAKEREGAQSKKTLRELDEDLRNQLEAGSYYFGTLGAGDSSAAVRASEAVAKQGSKSRGNVFEARDTAYREIEFKRTEVDRLANEQLVEIENWKSGKLYEISDFYQQQINKLNEAKANATTQEREAIRVATGELQNDYLGRIRQLSDATLQYKAGIDTWNRNRQAQLEDYQMQLSQAAAFKGGNYDALRKAALSAFNTNLGNMPANPNRFQDARLITIQQYGIDPASGNPAALAGGLDLNQYNEAFAPAQDPQDEYYRRLNAAYAQQNPQQAAPQQQGSGGFLGFGNGVDDPGPFR